LAALSEPAVRTSALGAAHAIRRQSAVGDGGYSGWKRGTYIAEEVRRPERTLPAAIARRYARCDLGCIWR